jgi:quercetin dioxygenase-like cupin family protein
MPFVSRPGEGPAYWVVGSPYTILATGEQTGGAYALIDMPVVPGSGSPPHTHTREDEAFYVLEGTIEFQIGEENIHAGPGTLVHGARGVLHWFRNSSDRPARMLVFIQPAGLEKFFMEVGVPVLDPNETPPPPDLDKIMDCAARYGMTIATVPV